VIRLWAFAFLLASAALVRGRSEYGYCQTEGGKAVVKDDSRQVVSAALALARSANAADHKLLASQLSDPAFLASLDSAEEYRQTGRRLRVARVLEALASNPAPSAKEVLVHLTGNSNFAEEPTRIDYLIRYTAGIAPPPPPLLQFWDKYSQPDDGFTPLTIEALTKNGSQPALSLLEQKLADPSHAEEDKQFWMRSYLLPHRNEAPLLKMVNRFLLAKVPSHLKVDLVEAMFDYQPDQWYPESAVIRPPDRSLASPEAKEILKSIGQYALKNLSLPLALRTTVEKVLMQLGLA
jgi:hypothetical protein